MGLDLALMAWRLFALAKPDSSRLRLSQERAGVPVTVSGPSTAGRQPMTPGCVGTIAFVVLLMLLTVGMHAWAAC